MRPSASGAYPLAATAAYGHHQKQRWHVDEIESCGQALSGEEKQTKVLGDLVDRRNICTLSHSPDCGEHPLAATAAYGCHQRQEKCMDVALLLQNLDDCEGRPLAAAAAYGARHSHHER